MAIVAVPETAISCFSAVDDDLSQWRAYGFGEGGFSIGFEVRQLVLDQNRDKTYLAPVSYDAVLHRKIADALARQVLDTFTSGFAVRSVTREHWTNEFLRVWNRALTYIAPLIKHPKFAAEHEWRLVRPLQETDFPSLVYRPKQTLLARYLPLTIKTNEGLEGILPIVSIRVGPNRNKHVSRITVGDLLKSNNYPENMVRVIETDVPFQQV